MVEQDETEVHQNKNKTMGKQKSNLETLREAKEAVRRDQEYERERREPHNGPFTIDTSSREFRRHNPFHDDGSGHERGDD